MFPNPRIRRWRGALLFILLLAGFQQIGSAAWMVLNWQIVSVGLFT